MAFAQDGSPGLKAAVDAAWQRSPQARTLEARRDETLAGREAAQSWIAGSPTLGLAQRSDRWTDQNGGRETEVSVAAPIWLPGQKAARESLAQSSSDDLEAQIAATRLALAGEVRERLWAVAAAHEALSETEHHQHHLEAIAEEVLRRVKAGDLARTDGMLAQQEVLAARGAVAAAQAKLQEALGRYRVLTGQPSIPVLEVEPIAGNMAEPHPRLAAVRTALQRSQASLNVVNRTRSDPPTVGLSMRREQGNFAGPASRSVGIAVQIPFGTAARNRPLETAARTQIETATAEAAQAEVMLKADVDLAREQLDAARRSLEAASSRASLTRQHTELIEKAFKAGERGLADLLRSQALSHEAEVAERQQKVALGLAHARLNQALGILP
ncbi:TolC family protein [Noviherbaspirillum sp. CPCC 100848]|uniref:TolC family protein n=1 Tax=Noviherbaspirillum album TaxID=3080276 RepID=A0ABU6JI01_9BURK|nr:TolC family protein [Noviherbaspirillum sp. CPCC 100848]MEC4723307.1 TolC family protein [Noviherbaspirillum sp. CPCC 100848]